MNKLALMREKGEKIDREIFHGLRQSLTWQLKINSKVTFSKY